MSAVRPWAVRALHASSRRLSTGVYTHGHHASVICQHSARTAENSAAFLLPHLAEGAKVLDVGCGPGTITAGLARRVGPTGHVTAIDEAETVVQQAAAAASSAGLQNVSCSTVSVYDMPFKPASFDVVYAHQLLQHLSNPVDALRAMRRVVKPGGLIAVRESDYASMLGFPASPAIDEWRSLYCDVARRNGGEPDAGRHLVSWLTAAGCQLASIEFGASVVVYSPHNEPWRTNWGEAWAARTLHSNFGTRAVAYGLATRAQLEHISSGWVEWAARPDALFYYVNGEALVRIPHEDGSSDETRSFVGASDEARSFVGASDETRSSTRSPTSGDASAVGSAAGLAAAAMGETRCADCFITFATSADLAHHATHHCFPDDPDEVLRRFPAGSEAFDTVRKQRVRVEGLASNPRSAHSSVSAFDLKRGLVADIPISRLRAGKEGGEIKCSRT